MPNYDSFIVEYADQVGPSGAQDIELLNTSLEKALKKAKMSKLNVVELLLSKGIVNYNSAAAENDPTAMLEAKHVIEQQADMFKTGPSCNKLGLTESDLLPALVKEKTRILAIQDVSK